MKVAVVGSGYVGLVLGACLAETGNYLICADVDEDKIRRLKMNDVPIFEPGLESLIAENQASGRLNFTTDVGAAVEASEVVFIAVGTPPDEDGSADLQHVLDVARVIGDHMNETKVVVTKSTVPVGTAERVREAISSRTKENFFVCSNPEFLKEGAAIEDFMKPDRVVVGVDSEEAKEKLSELYAPFVRTGNPLIFMDIASAEVTKYAANAMLATRISFMNQIAQLCELAGANVHEVRRGIGTDSRIGPAFLFPGPGYGGSCFPKDVRALVKTAEDIGVSLDLLRSVELVNERQKGRLFEKLQTVFDGDLAGTTVAVWGLAFKAETDDMRESPSIKLVSSLLDIGAKVKAFDPQAMETAREIFSDTITYAEDEYDALDGSDALVIVTEWRAFRNPDFARIKSLLKRPVIVDGRGLFSVPKLRKLGFTYETFGVA